MIELTEEKLLELNGIGLIPGPGESEEGFAKRVEYSLCLLDYLPNELIENLSDEEIHKISTLHPACEKLKKLFDCSPEWPPLFFSNYKLPFWHGGCAWIFQMTETSPTSAFVQLRKSFRNAPTYLGIYDRNELLAHELAHIGRMMFHEPKFEEVLAYQTASSAYRRWLGPLVESSKESALFVLFLFVLIVFDFFLVAMDRSDAYNMALWLKAIPVLLLIAAGIRLWKKQRTFAACLKNLSGLVSQDKARHIAYRLQDHEILLFSKSSPEEIQRYADLRKQEELRWKVISKAYFYH